MTQGDRASYQKNCSRRMKDMPSLKRNSGHSSAMIQKNKWTITSLLMLLGILGLSACQSRLPECSDRLGCVTIATELLRQFMKLNMVTFQSILIIVLPMMQLIWYWRRSRQWRCDRLTVHSKLAAKPCEILCIIPLIFPELQGL